MELPSEQVLDLDSGSSDFLSQAYQELKRLNSSQTPSFDEKNKHIMNTIAVYQQRRQ